MGVGYETYSSSSYEKSSSDDEEVQAINSINYCWSSIRSCRPTLPELHHLQLAATGLGSASVGLDLLTEATSSYGLKTRPSSNATFPSLSSPGPYNSMAILPSEVIKKILDLEFVEMTVTSSLSRSKDALQEGFQLPIFRTGWNSIHWWLPLLTPQNPLLTRLQS